MYLRFCASEREQESVNKRDGERESICVCASMCVCVREKKSECMFVCVRESNRV